jgi:hypothetical protein
LILLFLHPATLLPSGFIVITCARAWPPAPTDCPTIVGPPRGASPNFSSISDNYRVPGCRNNHCLHCRAVSGARAQDMLCKSSDDTSWWRWRRWWRWMVAYDDMLRVRYPYSVQRLKLPLKSSSRLVYVRTHSLRG